MLCPTMLQDVALKCCERLARPLHHTSVFTYSHANTPLGQSERAYYLSYFIKGDITTQAPQSNRQSWLFKMFIYYNLTANSVTILINGKFYYNTIPIDRNLHASWANNQRTRLQKLPRGFVAIFVLSRVLSGAKIQKSRSTGIVMLAETYAICHLIDKW